MFEDDFYDDFADEDMSKLTKAQAETINAIKKKIADNNDPREKTVGDLVVLWDTSRLTYEDTDLPVTDGREELILCNYHSIVIQDKLDYKAKIYTLAGEFTKTLDIKIWNKNTDRVYRTSSEFVRLK